MQEATLLTFEIDSSRVVWKKHEQETVILDSSSGAYFVLNALGGIVWELAQAGESQPQIVDRIRRFYPHDEQAIERHVQGFISDLITENLLKVSNLQCARANAAAPKIEPVNEYASPSFQKFGDILEWGFGSTGINA